MNTSRAKHSRSAAQRLRLTVHDTALVTMVLLCVLTLAGAGWGQQTPEYKLGPEDVISVTVMNHAELSGEYFIPNDGTVSIPRVGQVAVSGKTLSEVATLVQTSLAKNTLRQPEVSVTLKNPRRQLVYVMGAVQRPGPCDMKPGWRVTEAVGAAGGLVGGIEPADCTVTILHSTDGKRESIPYQAVMQGDESRNPPVAVGDVITLEAVETISIYVMGKVNRPGVYSIRKSSAGILEALTVAGGTTDDAALSKVTVTHLNGKSETVDIMPVTLNGKQDTPVKLSPGDMVVVPDSIAKFAVLGWVSAPGFFPLRENQKVTLTDAIGMARGVDNRRGGLKSVAVLRTVDGKQQRLVFDITKFAKKGDATQNPQILAGDVVWVPETSKPDWERLLQGLSSGMSLLWTVDRFGVR